MCIFSIEQFEFPFTKSANWKKNKKYYLWFNNKKLSKTNNYGFKLWIPDGQNKLIVSLAFNWIEVFVIGEIIVNWFAWAFRRRIWKIDKKNNILDIIMIKQSASFISL